MTITLSKWTKIIKRYSVNSIIIEQNYIRLSRITQGYTELHRITQDYTGLHRITQGYTGLHSVVTCNGNFSYCVAWIKVEKMFVWERYKSLCIYINTIYINKNYHCRSWHNAAPQGFPLLSTNVGISSLYGLIVASW